MAKKNYELINRGEVSVVIKMETGVMIEVNAEFDYGTMKIRKYGDNEQWTYRLMMHQNDDAARWQGRKQTLDYYLSGDEKALSAAEKRVRGNIQNIKKLIKEGHNNPIWLQLKPIADEIIKHWATDFYYQDCKIIQSENPTAFLWFVRETGTHFVTSQNVWNDYIVNNNVYGHKIYWYNNGKLTEAIGETEVKRHYAKLPKD